MLQRGNPGVGEGGCLANCILEIMDPQSRAGTGALEYNPGWSLLYFSCFHPCFLVKQIGECAEGCDGSNRKTEEE